MTHTRAASADDVLPRLTEKIMRAACKAHYGTDNIDGLNMTCADIDYSFRDAFQRMWSGIRATLSSTDAGETKKCKACGCDLDDNGDCAFSGPWHDHVAGEECDGEPWARAATDAGEPAAPPSGNHPAIPENVRDAVKKVRDDYASQAKFADIEAVGYFREFIRRIDDALATRPAPSVVFMPGLLPAEIPQHLVDIATEATSGTGMPDHDYDDDVRLQLAAVFATIRHTMAAPSVATVTDGK